MDAGHDAVTVDLMARLVVLAVFASVLGCSWNPYDPAAYEGLGGLDACGRADGYCSLTGCPSWLDVAHDPDAASACGENRVCCLFRRSDTGTPDTDADASVDAGETSTDAEDTGDACCEASDASGDSGLDSAD